MATVTELKASLDEYGVTYAAKARKAELETLLADARQRASYTTQPMSYAKREWNYQRQNGHLKMTTRQNRQLHKMAKRAMKRRMDAEMAN
jgi:hypothetical protein